MNDSNPPSSPAEAPRPARNKGKLTGPKPPLRPGRVWSIRAKLQERRTRDLALLNLATDSKLRGCDPVALRVDDVAPNVTSMRSSSPIASTSKVMRTEFIVSAHFRHCLGHAPHGPATQARAVGSQSLGPGDRPTSACEDRRRSRPSA